MQAAVRSARQTVEQFLRAAVSGRPGDIADCYAPEVVIEMPFAIEALYPSRIEATRESLRARFDAGASVRRYTGLSDVTIHETSDPEVIVAEYTLHGQMTSTARSFTNRFAMVVTVRDGYIVHSRDYSDPIAAARLLGKVPDLIAALS
jgi:uncharacterized protein